MGSGAPRRDTGSQTQGAVTSNLHSPSSRTCRERNRVSHAPLSGSLSRREYKRCPSIGQIVRISDKCSLRRDIAISTVVRYGAKADLAARSTRRRTGQHRGAARSLRRPQSRWLGDERERGIVGGRTARDGPCNGSPMSSSWCGDDSRFALTSTGVGGGLSGCSRVATWQLLSLSRSVEAGSVPSSFRILGGHFSRDDRGFTHTHSTALRRAHADRFRARRRRLRGLLNAPLCGRGGSRKRRDGRGHWFTKPPRGGSIQGRR